MKASTLGIIQREEIQVNGYVDITDIPSNRFYQSLYVEDEEVLLDIVQSLFEVLNEHVYETI